MIRPRAVDDFVAIRARMKELRYERTRLPVNEETGPNSEDSRPSAAARPGVPGRRVSRRRPMFPS
jgi:hypothetical protein